MYLDTISIYYDKLQKKLFSKLIHMKKFFFDKKDIQSFSKVIILARCILFAPHNVIYGPL
jgi:hypothetical protein